MISPVPLEVLGDIQYSTYRMEQLHSGVSARWRDWRVRSRWVFFYSNILLYHEQKTNLLHMELKSSGGLVCLQFGEMEMALGEAQAAAQPYRLSGTPFSDLSTKTSWLMDGL